MKKLGISLAVAAAVGAGAAGAYTVGQIDNGVLVPNTIHGAEGTTAVGLINHSSDKAMVYWTFFDENSKHITDGELELTANDFAPFVWADESGLGLEDVRGYLVFYASTDKNLNPQDDAGKTPALISATAIQYNAAAQDVAYIPTFPVNAADLDPAATDLSDLNAGSLRTLRSAQPAGTTFDMRYDFSNNEWDSSILLWATGGLNTTTTANMYDDEQNRKSVNFGCGASEQCFVNVKTIVGRPADFTRGFIRYTYVGEIDQNTKLNIGGSALSYTSVKSVVAGSTQTLLNAHD